MLEQLRRQSGSFIIWFLFAIIIAAFVLFFGPQASGELGCGASESYVVQVDGRALDIHDWRFAMNSQRGGTPVAERQTRALDALVARSILADAAREAGFDVSEDHVVENLKRGIIYILGMRINKNSLFQDGVFDYETLEALARQRGLPGVNYLIEQQKEEVLANLMRTMLVQTPVSRDEAKALYIQQNTTATAEYVKFDVAKYRQSMTVSEDDIRRYLEAHEDEIAQLYESRKSIYEDVKPQVRVRHIMFPFDPNDPAAKVAANVKAKAAAARLDKGEDFAAVAKDISEHAASKNRGGDLGWRPLASIGFGKELSDAAADLKEGQVSDLIETSSAVHILRIDGRREGKLSYDDVKLELAEDKARAYYARQAAERDAETALAKLKAGATLEELFGGDAGDPGGAKEDGDKTGSLHWESENIPASWGPVAQAAGAAQPAGKADEAKTAPVDPMKEEIALPPYETPKLEVQTLGPAPRRGEVLPGLGRAPELSEALFKSVEVGETAPEVYEVAGGFAIARLTDRQKADLEKFDGGQVHVGDDLETCSFPLQLVAATRNADALPAECLAIKRGIDNLQEFLYEQCSEAAQAGRIRVNEEFLRNESGEFRYTPCGTLNFETALIQVMSLPAGL